MRINYKNPIILGGGITGLTVGYQTGFPIFEAKDIPGGICASYYMEGGRKILYAQEPAGKEVYRFEIGGGHWIFGADQGIERFIRALTPIKSYTRLSSVYFSDKNLHISYPIQYNVECFGKKLSNKIVKEMRSSHKRPSVTLKGWLTESFGVTLCRLFFYPFNNSYTAGLYGRIAPQDTYKTPASSIKKRSALKAIGYNAIFIYPENGLNELIKSLAEKCHIFYNKTAVKIDLEHKEIHFADNSSIAYKDIISTLPLNKVVRMAGLRIKARPDPYTSVLVINIGAVKGKYCPLDHWLYVPDSRSGFFRVGFYSNVDASFLPKSCRNTNDKVSIYVERAFGGGERPSKKQTEIYFNSVIKELKKWCFIKNVEAKHVTWLEVAYTWSWPGSTWRKDALELLRKNDVYQMGRYGRWRFQGIAESIKEGLCYRYLLH